MNLFKRFHILFKDRAMKELALSYDRDADYKDSVSAAETAYKVIDEAVKPWLSPLEAKLLHDTVRLGTRLSGMTWEILGG